MSYPLDSGLLRSLERYRHFKQQAKAFAVLAIEAQKIGLDYTYFAHEAHGNFKKALFHLGA